MFWIDKKEGFMSMNIIAKKRLDRSECYGQMDSLNYNNFFFKQYIRYVDVRVTVVGEESGFSVLSSKSDRSPCTNNQQMPLNHFFFFNFPN